MNHTQLLLCVLGISATFFEHTEARSAGRLKTRIKGGDNASEAQFPYQVSVQSYGTHYCGGSILSERFILSAAHCFVNMTTLAFYDIPVEVIAGITDLKSKSKDKVSVRVIEIYVPKEYDPTKKFTQPIGDIAVLKLSNNLGIVGNSKLAKIKLPSKTKTYAGLEAIATGFGYNSIQVRTNPQTRKLEEFNGKSFNKLRYAKATVMSVEDCLPYVNPKVTEKHMCAAVIQRSYNPEGICRADSGGPLVHKGIQIGVISTSPRGCSETHEPSIYTRVSSFVDFINKIVDGKIDVKNDDSIRVRILNRN